MSDLENSSGAAAAPRVATYATVTSDDLVTGEAVALDLPAASVGQRMVSGLIDFIATWTLLIVLLLLGVVATVSSDQALQRIAQVGVYVGGLLAFPTALETLTRGRSLGKLAMGLRTVRDDAGPISFHHAFVRALVGVVEIYLLFGVPAFLTALLSTRGKRLGDYAAGTYVVRDRVTLTLTPPPLMPPLLAGWAATADIARLPSPLALAVRRYLSRAFDIEPAARASLGVRLADEVSRYVAPLPPAGTPPEAFLAAVVAARRERDSARLAREQALRDRLVRR